MTGSSGDAQTYHELSAIARTAASLVEQIAPGRQDAYLATSTLLACVLVELGVPTMAVRGYYCDEAHSWLEADGFRIDLARALFDNGTLVEPLTVPSGYVAEMRFSACWTPEDAVAQFASVFEFPEISWERGWCILDHLIQTSLVVESVA